MKMSQRNKILSILSSTECLIFDSSVPPDNPQRKDGKPEPTAATATGIGLQPSAPQPLHRPSPREELNGCSGLSAAETVCQCVRSVCPSGIWLQGSRGQLQATVRGDSRAWALQVARNRATDASPWAPSTPCHPLSHGPRYPVSFCCSRDMRATQGWRNQRGCCRLAFTLCPQELQSLDSQWAPCVGSGAETLRSGPCHAPTLGPDSYAHGSVCATTHSGTRKGLPRPPGLCFLRLGEHSPVRPGHCWRWPLSSVSQAPGGCWQFLRFGHAALTTGLALDVDSGAPASPCHVDRPPSLSWEDRARHGSTQGKTL